MDLDSFMELCEYNYIDSEELSEYFIMNYNFKLKKVQNFIKTLFLNCHFSFRKLLSSSVIKRCGSDSELVQYLVNNKLLDTMVVKKELKLDNYCDLIDKDFRKDFEPIIIIYNRYDV